MFEKGALSVSNTFRNVFSTFGSPFILHTDNGKEFCNTGVSDICNEFNIRHVKGRARCSRIQGRVERCNQTLKYMIGSTLRTKGMAGRWTEVRERIACSHNDLRHSTTAQTPTNLVFCRPIHEILNFERANELYNF